jgi:subtilisin
MKRSILPLSLLLFSTGCEELLVSAKDSDLVTGVYFVKLNAEAAEVTNLATDIAGVFGFDVMEVLHIYDSASEGFSVRIPHSIVPELENTEYVEMVLEDDGDEYVVPSEPEAAYEYGDDEVPPGIVRIGGPYAGSMLLDGIHVAVIDTGIDSLHPDLNVVGEIDLVGMSTGEFAEGADPNGHGTHVAGTIGAIADGAGVAGVAPGVSLHAVRVLGADGSGYFSDILAGMEYVLDNPEIRVVNMSLGGPMSSGMESIAEAIQRLEEAGVVVCIAAGNEAQDTANVAPAGFDIGIVVSAYDVYSDGSTISDRGFAWFSNYGDAVDISAPGVSINSTWPDGTYMPLDGTSMATPHVAGAVAAFLANSSDDITTDEVREAVVSLGEGGYSGQTEADGQHPEPFLDFAALMDAAVAMDGGDTGGEGEEGGEESGGE